MSAPHSQMLPSDSALGRGRAPHLQMLPSESASGALASRRSAAVLATQMNAMAQPRPRFARNTMRRRYLRLESRLQRCTSRAGRSAGRSMPKPPECKVTSLARGNRTCSASGIVSRSAPRDSVSRMGFLVPESETIVNKKASKNDLAFCRDPWPLRAKPAFAQIIFRGAVGSAWMTRLRRAIRGQRNSARGIGKSASSGPGMGPV